MKFKKLNNALQTIGKLRFNTIFVRNLVFLTNAYRSLRYKLHNDLMYGHGITVKDNAITRPENTEYILHQTRKIPQNYDEKYGYDKRMGAEWAGVKW